MKKSIFLFTVLIICGIASAQSALLSSPVESNDCSLKPESNYHLGLSITETELSSGYSSFTRGSGFFIRPELHGGLFATFGYQINPFIQTELSFGLGHLAYGFWGLSSSLGARAYTADADWAAMFDLRFSIFNFSVLGTTFAAGASYKDLDFGAGLSYYTDGYYYLIVPLLTVGWNIRCYDHR